MRIKVLRNLGQGLPQWKENQVVDADDDTANRLIQQSLAEKTDDPVGPPPVPMHLRAPAPQQPQMQTAGPAAIQTPGAPTQVETPETRPGPPPGTPHQPEPEEGRGTSPPSHGGRRR